MATVSGRRRRSGLAAATAVVLGCGLTACVPSDPRQPPSLVGVRADGGGGLAVWTGQRCKAVSWVRVELSTGPTTGARRVQWKITADSAAGSPIETFVVGKAVAGFHQTTALPVGFDWRDFDTADVVVYDRGAARAHLSRVRDAGTHRPDQYYFEKQGWLDRAQLSAAHDGFTTPCADDNSA